MSFGFAAIAGLLTVIIETGTFFGSSIVLDNRLLSVAELKIEFGFIGSVGETFGGELLMCRNLLLVMFDNGFEDCIVEVAVTLLEFATLLYSPVWLGVVGRDRL